MTFRQFLLGYLEPVHRFTGLRDVESFWAHSALLSAEVLCVVGLMALAFSRISSYIESIKPPVVRAAVLCVLVGLYLLVFGTSMLLFFDHPQMREHFNQGSLLEYAYVGAAVAFFLLGWSPMFYLHWRKTRLNANGA